MKIRFIGHSCFLVTAGDGIRIITDPYEPGCYGGALKYRPIVDEADIALVSHSHPDHCAADKVPGKPRVIDREGAASFGPVEVLGVQVWHDASGGSERGKNIIFRVRADGLSLCHMGDVGHRLEAATAARLLPVDVLFLPVGGHFTADSDSLDDIIRALEPRLIIPMHFKTPGVDFPIAPVENFLEGRKGAMRPGSSEATLAAGDIPRGILVLEPANLP